MIISHSKKFCYWKIARTGSNTAELCIRMSGGLDLSKDIVTSCHFFPASHNVEENESGHTSGHTTPEAAIEQGYLTRKQYEEYDHYTIVRNPLERWISAYAFRCRMHMHDRLTPQEFYENFKTDLVTKRQSEYLKLGGVQTFPFSDYEKSIRTIVAAIGGRLEDVPKLEHKTSSKWLRYGQSEVTENNPLLRNELLSYYETDFELGY